MTDSNSQPPASSASPVAPSDATATAPTAPAVPAAPPAPAGPRAYRLGDLLSATFPPDNCIISDGLLSRNGIMVIGGPPKAYKSFTLGTIVYHLTTGTNLFEAARRPHGRAIPVFTVERPQRVLLLEQEIGAADLQLRYRSLFARLTPDQQRLMSENLITYSCDSELQLDTPQGINRLLPLLKHYRPDVVCFDPLIEFHTSDENSTQQMAHIMRNIDRLRWTYHFSTIISHHCGKQDPNSSRSGPDLLRGNSVVFGKGDSFLMLNPVNRNAGIIQVEFTIRRGKPLDDMTIKLDWEDLRAKFHAWGAYSPKKGRTRGDVSEDDPRLSRAQDETLQ